MVCLIFELSFLWFFFFRSGKFFLHFNGISFPSWNFYFSDWTALFGHGLQPIQLFSIYCPHRLTDSWQTSVFLSAILESMRGFMLSWNKHATYFFLRKFKLHNYECPRKFERQVGSFRVQLAQNPGTLLTLFQLRSKVFHEELRRQKIPWVWIFRHWMLSLIICCFGMIENQNWLPACAWFKIPAKNTHLVRKNFIWIVS